MNAIVLTDVPLFSPITPFFTIFYSTCKTPPIFRFLTRHNVRESDALGSLPSRRKRGWVREACQRTLGWLPPLGLDKARLREMMTSIPTNRVLHLSACIIRPDGGMR